MRGCVTLGNRGDGLFVLPEQAASEGFSSGVCRGAAGKFYLADDDAPLAECLFGASIRRLRCLSPAALTGEQDRVPSFDQDEVVHERAGGIDGGIVPKAKIMTLETSHQSVSGRARHEVAGAEAGRFDREGFELNRIFACR